MLDTHVTLLEAHHFRPFSRHFGLLMVLGLETGPLTVIGLCNTTFLKGKLHASAFVVCWRKCVIEIKTFFQQKNVEQTSLNMHASRPIIVDPTNVLQHFLNV